MEQTVETSTHTDAGGATHGCGIAPEHMGNTNLTLGNNINVRNMITNRAERLASVRPVYERNHGTMSPTQTLSGTGLTQTTPTHTFNMCGASVIHKMWNCAKHVRYM